MRWVVSSISTPVLGEEEVIDWDLSRCSSQGLLDDVILIATVLADISFNEFLWQFSGNRASISEQGSDAGIEISDAVDPDVATDGVDTSSSDRAAEVKWIVTGSRVWITDVGLSWGDADAIQGIESSICHGTIASCCAWGESISSRSLRAWLFTPAGSEDPHKFWTKARAVFWKAVARASVRVEEFDAWLAFTLVGTCAAHAAFVVENFSCWAVLLDADALAHLVVPFVVRWAFLLVADTQAHSSVPVA